MAHCYPKRNPLNGSSANTEGGRLRRSLMNCVETKMIDTIIGTNNVPCKKSESVLTPITPAESSYLMSKMLACGNFQRSGAITQDEAKRLLAMASSRQQYGSEGVRIARIEQQAIFCATDPESETSRFSNYVLPPTPFVCPPLPPPPAPPAKQCPLQKNQKF